MVVYQIKYGGNIGELYITGKLSKEDKRRLKDDKRKTRDSKSD